MRSGDKIDPIANVENLIGPKNNDELKANCLAISQWLRAFRQWCIENRNQVLAFDDIVNTINQLERQLLPVSQISNLNEASGSHVVPLSKRGYKNFQDTITTLKNFRDDFDGGVLVNNSSLNNEIVKDCKINKEYFDNLDTIMKMELNKLANAEPFVKLYERVAPLIDELIALGEKTKVTWPREMKKLYEDYQASLQHGGVSDFKKSSYLVRLKLALSDNQIESKILNEKLSKASKEIINQIPDLIPDLIHTDQTKENYLQINVLAYEQMKAEFPFSYLFHELNEDLRAIKVNEKGKDTVERDARNRILNLNALILSARDGELKHDSNKKNKGIDVNHPNQELLLLNELENKLWIEYYNLRKARPNSKLADKIEYFLKYRDGLNLIRKYGIDVPSRVKKDEYPGRLTLSPQQKPQVALIDINALIDKNHESGFNQKLLGKLISKMVSEYDDIVLFSSDPSENKQLEKLAGALQSYLKKYSDAFKFNPYFRVKTAIQNNVDQTLYQSYMRHMGVVPVDTSIFTNDLETLAQFKDANRKAPGSHKYYYIDPPSQKCLLVKEDELPFVAKPNQETITMAEEEVMDHKNLEIDLPEDEQSQNALIVDDDYAVVPELKQPNVVSNVQSDVVSPINPVRLDEAMRNITQRISDETKVDDFQNLELALKKYVRERRIEKHNEHANYHNFFARFSRTSQPAIVKISAANKVIAQLQYDENLERLQENFNKIEDKIKTIKEQDNPDQNQLKALQGQLADMIQARDSLIRVKPLTAAEKIALEDGRLGALMKHYKEKVPGRYKDPENTHEMLNLEKRAGISSTQALSIYK